VIAYELGIDIKLINITTTSTEKIPNFTNTGGSGTSETTCQAAVIACQVSHVSCVTTMPIYVWSTVALIVLCPHMFKSFGPNVVVCRVCAYLLQQLNAVLAPIKQAHPTANWPTLCGLAVAGGLCLSSVGHFSLTSEAGGFPFTYFVYAAACSEVELDVLTGEVSLHDDVQ